MHIVVVRLVQAEWPVRGHKEGSIRGISCIGTVTLATLLTLLATAANAQQPLAVPPSSPQFLPRFDFQISLAGVSSADPRFKWDGRINGDFDVVDYVKGRTSIFAQYEVVAGNQLRPFDPNQGNYTFEGSSSLRVRGTEIAGVFHHVSRHLSDRSNLQSISYNGLGPRAMRHFDFNKTSLDVRGDIEKVSRHEFLDYSWTAGLHLLARKPIGPRTSVFASGDLETYGVDHSVAGRGEQNGGRLEGGLRLKGGQGSVEFFGGWEQVVDAYPLDRGPMRWAFVGFRLRN
jgi:hypothetical protein